MGVCGLLVPFNLYPGELIINRFSQVCEAIIGKNPWRTIRQLKPFLHRIPILEVLLTPLAEMVVRGNLIELDKQRFGLCNKALGGIHLGIWTL